MKTTLIIAALTFMTNSAVAFASTRDTAEIVARESAFQAIQQAFPTVRDLEFNVHETNRRGTTIYIGVGVGSALRPTRALRCYAVEFLNEESDKVKSISEVISESSQQLCFGAI